MLTIYFIHRRDIVGIFGQVLPLLIYVRNLYFIYRLYREAVTAQLPTS